MLVHSFGNTGSSMYEEVMQFLSINNCKILLVAILYPNAVLFCSEKYLYQIKNNQVSQCDGSNRLLYNYFSAAI